MRVMARENYLQAFKFETVLEATTVFQLASFSSMKIHDLVGFVKLIINFACSNVS